VEKKIELDWDKWFKGSTDLPREGVPDKKTGLLRYAVSRRGFDKYIKLMTEQINEKEALEKGTYWTRSSGEKLRKQLLEGLKFILLSDEEIYKLNPEFYEEMGIVKR
jgi:hypothetical protein